MKRYVKYLLLLPPALLCCVAILFHQQKNAPRMIRAVTETDRSAWLMLQGWHSNFLSSRPVAIPENFPESYSHLQELLHLPLHQYAGKHGVLYTYQLENSSLYAELLTADGMLIGAQCYDPEQQTTLDFQGKPPV